MYLGQKQKKILRTMSGVILVVFLIVFLFPRNVFADTRSDLLNQINNLDKQIQEQKNLLNQKIQERNTLENQLAILNGQINEIQYSISKTQTEIQLTQAEIENLKQQIQQKEEELAYQKEILGENIRVIYQETDVSFIETIFSSNSISQVIDRTEYLSAIEGKITATMAEISQIKSVLAQNKKEQEQKVVALNDKKNQLVEQNNSLSSSKDSYALLLSITRGQEAQYQAILAALQKDKAGAQRILNSLPALGGGSRGGSGTGGYPDIWANAPIDTIVDDWGFWNRECTSYAAWYWNVKLGKRWYNTQPGRGSAKYWGEIAATLGYSVSDVPRVGSIAMWQTGTWGHVAIVMKVNPNGTFDVSEYNYIPGQYGERYGVSNNGLVSFIY